MPKENEVRIIVKALASGFTTARENIAKLRKVVEELTAAQRELRAEEAAGGRIDIFGKAFRNTANDLSAFQGNLKGARTAEADYFSFTQSRSREAAQAKIADIKQQVAAQKVMGAEASAEQKKQQAEQIAASRAATLARLADIKQQVAAQKVMGAEASAEQKKQQAEQIAASRAATLARLADIKQQVAAQKELGKSFLQTTPAIQNIIDKTASLAGQAAIATGILVTFGAAVKKAYDFGKEGAQIERLRVTGTALAKSFGVNMDEATAKLKTASLETVSANQAVMDVNRLLLLGITTDVTKMGNLMQIAALRGRAFGLSTEEAFDRISLGIGRLSTRILDDIGIVVDGETAYANYGKAIGKVADDLTEAEKREALLNAILVEGNKLLEANGGLAEDNAAHFEQLTAHWTDFINSLKESLSGPVGDIILALDRILFGNVMVMNALKEHHAEVEKGSQTYAEYSEEFDRSAEAAGLLVAANGDLWRGAINARVGISQLVEADAKLSEAQFNVLHSLEQVTDQFDRHVEKLRETVTAVKAVGYSYGRAFVDAFEDAWDKAYEAAKDSQDKIKDLQEDLIDVQNDLNDALSDLNVDFTREAVDDEIDYKRKLRDIDEKAADERENADREHNKKLIDIEKDYQRDVDRILRRFELAKFRALVDLDARALAEAELQRDLDLADARKSADEKKADEVDSFNDRMAEIDRQQAEEKADAEQDYNDRREDAQRHYAQDQFDLIANALQREAILRAQLAEEERLLRESLDRRRELWRRYYGDIPVGAGGIVGGTGGGLPPAPYGTEPPPGSTTVPPEPETIIAPPGGPGMTMPTNSLGAGQQNVRVTLNINANDSVLARLVKTSTYDAIVDVFSE